MLFAPGMRVKFPDRGPGITVQGGDQVLRGARVQNVTNLQRGIFVYPGTGARSTTAGSIGPGDLQVLDVVRGDLGVRGKTCSRSIASEKLPIVRATGGLFGHWVVGGRVWVGNNAMGIKRGNECCDQSQEYSKTKAVRQASGTQRGVRQGCSYPQTEGQDYRWNDQTWQQFPVAELSDFIKGPDTSSQKYRN